MVNSIPVIAVAATLEGVKYDEDFIPKEETKERMITLGIQTLLDIDKIDASKSLELLEANVWKLASNIKKRQFGYGKKDFINSLKFLEVFCIYSGQANLANQRNKKVLEENMDKNVLKAVKEIEYINKLLDADTKKNGKSVLKQHTERLINLINKIFTGNLSQTEQIALGKIVERAEKILQKMSN